jgi:hypothetical protein
MGSKWGAAGFAERAALRPADAHEEVVEARHGFGGERKPGQLRMKCDGGEIHLHGAM